MFIFQVVGAVPGVDPSQKEMQSPERGRRCTRTNATNVRLARDRATLLYGDAVWRRYHCQVGFLAGHDRPMKLQKRDQSKFLSSRHRRRFPRYFRAGPPGHNLMATVLFKMLY